MTTHIFFKQQSEITKLKILIYENYITFYLIRCINYSRDCYLFDLFCGPGRNGNKLGSSLILIDIIKKLLKLKYINNNLKVHIFFNDINQKYTNTLRNHIQKMGISNNVKIEIYNKSFKDIYPLLLTNISKDSYKFFLLDPFGYSNILIYDLKQIFSLPNTEILLFIPIFHPYRFSYYLRANGKVKEFLKTYTTKGIYQYKNIYTFTKSILNKLSNILNTKFIREFIIRNGSQVNAMFLITKDIKSMLIGNNIFWQYSKDRKEISTKIQNKKLNIKQIVNNLFKNIPKKTLRTHINVSKYIVNSLILKGFGIKHIKIIYSILCESFRNRKINNNI